MSSRSLNPAAQKVLQMVESGEWSKLSNVEKYKLLNAADAGASTLTANWEMYEKAGVANALHHYLGDDHQKINGVLAGTVKSTPRVQKYISDMDKAIGMKTLDKDIVVWRGSHSKEGKSGRFVSTSLSAGAAEGFNYGNHLHAYRIPKGTKYFYSGTGEHEVILPRGFNLGKYKIK